jgi:hypothetical protein
MQGIYTYIPETNPVPKEHNVAAILSLLFMVPISLVPVLLLLLLQLGCHSVTVVLIPVLTKQIRINIYKSHYKQYKTQ